MIPPVTKQAKDLGSKGFYFTHFASLEWEVRSEVVRSEQDRVAEGLSGKRSGRRLHRMVI